MSGLPTDPSALTLHAIRLLGFDESHRIAHRYGLDRDQTEECLLDFEAHGWVTRSEFAGTGGWALTERGRAESEGRLAAELDASGARSVVSGVYQRFLPLNVRFQDAATRWQVRGMPWDSMAANDHTDFRWDDRVIAALGSVGRKLAPLGAELAAAVPRFGGYAVRYDAALARVTRGEARWVDGLGIDSCHVDWMQLHEDLLATLGLHRSDEP
jgi:hypothetical protein